MPPSEISRLVRKIRAACQGTYAKLDAGLLFVALSYRWLQAGHPDPDGFQLRIVAAALEQYLQPQHGAEYSPLTDMFRRLLPGEQPECVLFWDFVR